MNIITKSKVVLALHCFRDENKEVIKENIEHNHSADMAIKSLYKIKSTAKETEETPRVIVLKVSKVLIQATCDIFPSISTMKRTIRRIKEAIFCTLALPQSLQKLEFPEKYATIFVVLFDFGKEDSNSNLIFSIQENLTYLSISQYWYMDETFKTVPAPFYKLYTKHGLKLFYKRHETRINFNQLRRSYNECNR